MIRAFHKTLGYSVRIFAKFYEIFLGFYSFLRRGLDPDHSKILIDHYTEEQSNLQAEIDSALRTPVGALGELLVLIPFRDRWDLTEACLHHLAKQKHYSGMRFKTILIDNGSTAPETIAGMAQAGLKFPHLHIEVHRADYAFNYSRLNNDAFRGHVGKMTKWVLFLNNDVELREENIVEKMISSLDSIPGAGVVGCSLLYPNQRLQHIFAAPGVKIIAAHPLRGSTYDPAMAWFAKPVRPVAAVTGALLAMRAADFAAAGMFDENLPTLGQDVILCLNTRRKLGKYPVVLTSGGVIHHESLTKPSEFPLSEVSYIYQTYGDLLSDEGLFSLKLSRWSERPLCALPCEPAYPATVVVRCWS